MRSEDAAQARPAALLRRERARTWSNTSAGEDLAKSTAVIGLGGLVLGRMKARSRSLSRKIISAGMSVPSCNSILKSLTSDCTLYLEYSSGIMRCSISLGSHAESDRTVRPEGSTTVPVISCLVSREADPEEDVFRTTCTVTTVP